MLLPRDNDRVYDGSKRERMVRLVLWQWLPKMWLAEP
jgi:hypothetical protein